MSELEDAIESFPEEPMAVVIIGHNGAERVWLSHEIEGPAQYEWAAKHIIAAATIALEMTPGTSRA